MTSIGLVAMMNDDGTHCVSGRKGFEAATKNGQEKFSRDRNPSAIFARSIIPILVSGQLDHDHRISFFQSMSVGLLVPAVDATL